MNITIPSMAPCIIIEGNTGLFILGVGVGLILGTVLVWPLCRQI